jgi:hypothetical protein
MIQRIRGSLRVVLPVESMVLVFFGILGCFYLLALFRSKFDFFDAWESLDALRIMLTWCTAGVYGFFRGTYFHPVENRAYGRWLKLSPWRHPDPLPLGPLHLVWQDALIVALLTAFFPRELFSVLSVPSLFLVAYSYAISYSHWKVGIDWVAFINAILGGTLLLVIVNSIAVLVVALLTYAVAQFGTRLILRAFPFDAKLQEWLKLKLPSTDREASAGWPLPPANESRWNWRISRVRAAGLALSVGWLQFCLFFHFRDVPDILNAYMTTYLWIVVFFVFGRLWVYLWGYAPPISVFGRLATGRLVIPGYDVALLAPLIATIVACTLPELLTRLEVAPSFAYPISASVVAWLALTLPPQREAWQLTGHHRIAYRFLAKSATRSQSKAQASR